MPTLPAFSAKQAQDAKIFLATQVAAMMGRKLEEGDWSKVYCRAKGIPEAGWSNLHIDVNYNGFGLEMKLLRISNLRGKPLKSVCGTALMHPAATRAIRIDDVSLPAQKVMQSVFAQYAELIQQRTARVLSATPGVKPDMRIGWFIWEDELTEFLYFEEPMMIPDPSRYFAEWNVTPARGVRKASKSLWIYDKTTKQKRYSVTTSAGIKIQPYFDVPAPSDANLYYFRVQSEPVGADRVQIWVSAATAREICALVGSLEVSKISQAVIQAAEKAPAVTQQPTQLLEQAEPIQLTNRAFEVFKNTWIGVSDEHRAQLLVQTLRIRSSGPTRKHR